MAETTGKIKVVGGLISPALNGFRAEIRVEGPFDTLACIIYRGIDGRVATCRPQFVQRHDGLGLEEVHVHADVLVRCAWMMQRKVEDWPWVDVEGSELRRLDVTQLDRYARGLDT
jgi:hypothetical protein